MNVNVYMDPIPLVGVTIGLHYRIPDSVWLCLFAAAFCAIFAVGYQFGISIQKVGADSPAAGGTIFIGRATGCRSGPGIGRALKVELQPMQYLQKQLDEVIRNQRQRELSHERQNKKYENWKTLSKHSANGWSTTSGTSMAKPSSRLISTTPT